MKYGVTAEEMDAFIRRADAGVARKEKHGGYVRFKGKLDPKALE